MSKTQGRVYHGGRQCPHVTRGCCEKCHDPFLLRRFRSRRSIYNPMRLEDAQRLAKENNPRPYPRDLK